MDIENRYQDPMRMVLIITLFQKPLSASLLSWGVMPMWLLSSPCCGPTLRRRDEAAVGIGDEPLAYLAERSLPLLECRSDIS